MSERIVHHLHPSWIVLRAIASLRAMALPLVIVLFTNRSSGELIWFVIAGGVIVLTIASRALAWWRFTYEITPQGVRVQSGLVSRQDRLMPFERIQSVDLRDGVLERVLGVSQVQIESAGGTAGSEIVLGAVSREEAANLRTNLLQQRHHVAPGESAQAAETAPSSAPVGASAATAVTGSIIHKVSIGHLLIAGATSSRIGPALALIAGGFQFADDILRDSWWDRVEETIPSLTLAIVVGLIVVALVFAWIFATISTVLTFGNFELRRDGDRLLISHGLLERRRSTIPLARIQAITISEGWLRQPFGLAVVRVESAGYGKVSAEGGVLAPIIRRSDIPALLERACPNYAIDLFSIPLERLPVRSRRRYILSYVWLALGGTVILTVAAAIASPSPWWWGLSALLTLPLAVAYGHLEWRDTGWAVETDDRVIIRTREIDRVTAITRRSRLQVRAISQNPLQRRAQLVTFSTAVASGGVGGYFAIVHLDVQQGEDLLSRLGPPPTRTTQTAPASPVTPLPPSPGWTPLTTSRYERHDL